MEFEKFNSDIHNTFVIQNLLLNEPIEIKYGDRFLSCHWAKNIVDFFIDGNSDKQRWIIEKDPKLGGIFYIRTQFERQNNIRYLGSPNKDGIVKLYTSRSSFTMWKITPKSGLQFNNSIYTITYAGTKFNTSEISLIIARYTEDIDWVTAYNDIAIVYNKGHYDLVGIKNVIHIENIGREGHTYLYHIIHNYENLTDRVIFSQGNPFDHNETILYGIDNHEKGLDVQPLGVRWLRMHNIPPIEIENKYKIITEYGLNYMTIKLDKNLISSEFYDKGMLELNENYRNDYKKFDNNHELVIDSITNDFLSRANFNYPNHIDTLQFTYSALFSVLKSKIYLHRANDYENLLKQLILIDNTGGANGYVLEKLWLLIFGYM